MSGPEQGPHLARDIADDWHQRFLTMRDDAKAVTDRRRCADMAHGAKRVLDAMDLPKADIVTTVGDFMSDCAEMLGVANDSDQIRLAIETLKVEREDAIQRAEKAAAVLGLYKVSIDGAEARIEALRGALSWYADDDNWTRNRPSGDQTSSIETGSFHIGDLRRPMVGLTVAIIDMGERARTALGSGTVPADSIAEARATAAEAEVADLARKLDEARPVYVTALALWRAVSLILPGGGKASKDTVYHASRALEDALTACRVWPETATATRGKPEAAEAAEAALPNRMEVRIEAVHDGLYLAMPIVDVLTADGETVEFEVSDRSIVDGYVGIGCPVARRADGALLIEFGTRYGCLSPGKHFGSHRVWVPAGSLRADGAERGRGDG